LNGHFNFVTHANKQESALSTVDRCLADKFVESLGVEFLTDGANSSLSCLTFFQFLVEFVLQNDHIEARCWNRGDVLYPELARI
jgi:hypothetical protein